jgi:hypothetical protein
MIVIVRGRDRDSERQRAGKALGANQTQKGNET